MARVLADAGMRAVFSYAGRTHDPVSQPLPQRVGGFGGVAGLKDYLRTGAITHVIDATHPFAAQMSRNAHAACTACGTPLVRLERPPWTPEPTDTWQIVPSMDALPPALPDTPARVFLAIGKQNLDLFACKPQHHYLLRLVDPPHEPIPLPHHTVTLARGPFDVAGDTALLQQHKITHIVAKNAGGTGAAAKLIAARNLGLAVILAQRPVLPVVPTANSTEDVMRWLSHEADRGV